MLFRSLGVAHRDEWQSSVESAVGQPALLLWTAEIWCRLFLDGDSVEEVEEALWTATPAAAP